MPFEFPTDADLDQTDRDMRDIADIFGYKPQLENEEPESTFLDRFKDQLEKGGYFEKSKEDSKQYDIYGDRRRSSGGDTVADLGGGNTLMSPDSSIATQAQLAGMQNQQKGLGQQLGAGTGAALGAAVGGPFAPVTSVLGRFAGDFLGGLLPF